MLTHAFTPRAETDALISAITHFQRRWAHKRTLAAVFDLADAVERAEDVLSELQRGKPDPQSDLALVVSHLQLLLGMARQELARVYDETLEEIGQRMVAEARPAIASSAVVPAGTILSCPQCEEGLYKVTVRATVNEIVLDDGKLLHPLNTTIPQRDAWRAFACPTCGGRYYKDGRLHTVQRGWV